MPIQFSGEFRARRKPEETYDFLIDPNRFCPLLPDFESMAIEDATHFRVKVKVGISHIHGTADMKLHLAEAERPRRAVFRGKGNVAGGSVDVTAGFDLEKEGDGTRVLWKGEAQIFGRLTAVAGGLLEPLAKKNLQRLMDGLQAALV